MSLLNGHKFTSLHMMQQNAVYAMIIIVIYYKTLHLYIFIQF